MFMNSNSLPVALMQSLATTVPLLKWGPDDTLDAMFGRSLTYLVVFSTLGMIVQVTSPRMSGLGVTIVSCNNTYYSFFSSAGRTACIFFHGRR
jgi:hypothetical protein